MSKSRSKLVCSHYSLSSNLSPTRSHRRGYLYIVMAANHNVDFKLRVNTSLHSLQARTIPPTLQSLREEDVKHLCARLSRLNDQAESH